MGLNPYFNESHSNLDYHEVQARIDNNSNVYERCTAHWYALANARSIGKPHTYAAQAEIFKTSMPGQLHLPKYVDPLANKWTNTHYTNQAIVGSDNVEGMTLNYENWHQGVGLNSIADEQYMASIRGVQHAARIDNLKELKLGDRVPDMRRLQNVRAGAAIINKVQDLRRKLEDPNFLPDDGMEPTPEQKDNIETFNEEVGMVAQAYASFSYGSLEDGAAVQNEINNFLKMDRKRKKNLIPVGSALNNLLQVVRSRRIMPLPSDPRFDSTDESLSKVGNVQAPQPGEQAAAAAAAAAAAPAPEVAASTAPAPEAASTAPAPEVAASPPVPEPTPDASAPASEPVASSNVEPMEHGDILHLSGTEISELPVQRFDAKIGEIRAMDSEQLKGFNKRYDELKQSGALPRKFLLDDFYTPYFNYRLRRAREESQGKFFPGADYHGEGWFSFLDNPILRRDDQYHRYASLQGGVRTRRGSVARPAAAPAPTPAVPPTPAAAPDGQPAATPAAQPGDLQMVAAPSVTAVGDPTVTALTKALIAANTNLSQTAIQALAMATKATIERRNSKAEKKVPVVAAQRPQPPGAKSSALSTIQSIGKGIVQVGLGGLAMQGLSSMGSMIAAGGAPSANDYSISEGILKPTVGLTEALVGPRSATLVGLAGSVLGPAASHLSRATFGLWSSQRVLTFITGTGFPDTASFLGKVIGGFANTIKETGQSFFDTRRNITEQGAINKGKAAALEKFLPRIQNVSQELEEAELAKRYATPTLVPIEKSPPSPPMPTPEGTSVPYPTPKVYEPPSIEPTPTVDRRPSQPSYVPGKPQPNFAPKPSVPTGGSGMRYMRGDLTDAERKAQKRIRGCGERAAEELQSDEENMDGEDGVQESRMEIVSSMNKGGKFSHRIPEGSGAQMPVLYGGSVDFSDRDVEVCSDMIVDGLFLMIDNEEAGYPSNPTEIADTILSNFMNTQVAYSNPDRLVVGVTDSSNTGVPDKDVLNKPEPTDFPANPSQLEAQLSGGQPIEGVHPLEGGALYRGPLEGGNFFKDLVDKGVAAVSSVASAAAKDPSKALDVLSLGNKLYNASDDQLKLPTVNEIANIGKKPSSKRSLSDLHGGESGPAADGTEPTAKRQREGEKPKRKVSEWSKLVAAVYKELKEKDPNVTIAMAAKEASKRRKA
jgi:hypothetical protein